MIDLPFNVESRYTSARYVAAHESLLGGRRVRPYLHVVALLLAVALIMFAATSLAGADPAGTQPTAPATPPPDSATPATPAPAWPTPPPTAPTEENSISYTTGFSDGCASSNLRYAHSEHVKPGRDANLYENDLAYHHGWDKGYRTCEDKVNPGGLSVPGNSVIL